MTYQEAAQTAIDVQDACNLSGVVHSMGLAVSAVWDEARRQGKGTEFVNSNPIMYLYIDKLASLNRTQCLCADNLRNYGKAYADAQTIALSVDPARIAWIESILSSDENSTDYELGLFFVAHAVPEAMAKSYIAHRTDYLKAL